MDIGVSPFGAEPSSTSLPSSFLPELRRSPYCHRGAPGSKTTSLVESDETARVKDVFKDATVMVQLLTHMHISLTFLID